MKELHELPDTESIKSWTNRLASKKLQNPMKNQHCLKKSLYTGI